ncbi:hypothetical protein [Negadavirga shengliensis]|uniref:Uncharacterized protein n=1 Tax=Negadavirga shengliensis TaxID=1389218 RepID=A0ABV9T2R5_9BACT
MEKRVYKLSVFLLMVVFSLNGWAQENLIYEMVQQEKAKGMSFREISNAFKQAATVKSRTDHFINSEEVFFFEYDQSFLMEPLWEGIFLSVPIRQKVLQLELVEVPASFYSYKVTTSEGEELSADHSVRHYRGIVKIRAVLRHLAL